MSGGCVECVTDCEEPSCSAVELSQFGCTSQCVDIVHVVPCPYPDAPEGQTAPCYIECEDIPDCDACEPGKFASPCSATHTCLPDAFGPCSGARPLNSLPDASFEAWLCSTCNTMNKQQQHSDSNPSTPSMPKPLYPDSGMQHNQWPMNNSMTALYHDAFMTSMGPPIQLGGDALSKSSAPFKGLQSSNDHQDISRHSDHSSSLPSSLQSTPPLVHSTPSIPPPSFTCMWGDCLATFQHLSELVGHVNLQHLRLPSNSAPDTSVHTNESLPRLPFFDNRSPPSPSSSQLQPSPVPPGHDPNNIFCLWRNCHVAPTPNSTPGPSSGNVSDSFAEALAAHLWHDHLGLTTPLPNGLPNTLPQPNPPLPSLWDSNAQSAKPRSDEPSPPESDSGPETEDANHGHDCSVEVHRCLWQSCDQTFDTCDDLTNHLTSVHVGGGKGQYECRWNGCDRHGDRSFTSKQKICRHLQTHTGHRPFKCQICNERFSEAATLQQHIRRHTNEKPFKCSHSGCGKSFATRGALTIHERTHSGKKPFKCNFCERGFSESSNLSKHLRTHTGARPYSCSVCEKTFARPDQLSRHMGTHK